MVQRPEHSLNKHRHHIQGQKDQHLSQRYDKSHKYNQRCEKNEVVLGKDDRWTSRVTTYNMTRKYVNRDQPSGGETTWANT